MPHPVFSLRSPATAALFALAALSACGTGVDDPARCAESRGDDAFAALMQRDGRFPPDVVGERLPQQIASAPQWRAQRAGPAALACWADGLARRADEDAAAARPLSALFVSAARTIGHPLRVPSHAPPVDPARPLLAALDLLHGGKHWEGREAAARNASAVPLATQRAAARILLELPAVERLRRAGLRELLEPSLWPAAYATGADLWLRPGADDIHPRDPGFGRLLSGGESGYRLLYLGAARLLAAIDDADLAAAASAQPFEFYAATPLGGVLLRGGGDDVYDPGTDPRLHEVVLVMDTGGDDTVLYPAGATQSARNGIALHLDLGGDDRYDYKVLASPHDAPGLLPSDAEGRASSALPHGPGPVSLSAIARQGAGILGYGVLIDRGRGNDRYRSLSRSQGFGAFGVGVLADDGGDDVYEAESGAQAAAMSGIGLLVEGGGNDTYRAAYSAQAFAFLQAAAVLYEAAGNDRYELLQGPPILRHWDGHVGDNLSLGQGTAFGWRRREALSHPGGVALLRDREGDDRYIGSAFVQGAGYWMAVGVLADGEGNDRYNARHYAQGAGVHLAIGVMLECSGDDVYNDPRHGLPIQWSSIGHGHDLGVGVFVEDGGNDAYFIPPHGAGAGKCRGAGYFVDREGDDRYASERGVSEMATDLLPLSLGSAASFDWQPADCANPRRTPTYGYFADLDGRDDYAGMRGGPGGEGRRWASRDPRETLPVSGGGIDASAPSSRKSPSPCRTSPWRAGCGARCPGR